MTPAEGTHLGRECFGQFQRQLDLVEITCGVEGMPIFLYDAFLGSKRQGQDPGVSSVVWELAGGTYPCYSCKHTDERIWPTYRVDLKWPCVTFHLLIKVILNEIIKHNFPARWGRNTATASREGSGPTRTPGKEKCPLSNNMAKTHQNPEVVTKG